MTFSSSVEVLDKIVECAVNLRAFFVVILPLNPIG